MSAPFVVKIVKLKKDEEVLYGQRCKVFCGVAKTLDAGKRQITIRFQTWIFDTCARTSVLSASKRIWPLKYLEETLNNAVIEIARNGEDKIPRW